MPSRGIGLIEQLPKWNERFGMVEYIIGYGSIAIVVIWLAVLFVRARYYRKTSFKTCDMNCATCSEKCDDLEKKAVATASKKFERTETLSC